MNRVVKTIIFTLVVIGMIWLIVLLLSKAFSASDGKSATVQKNINAASYASTDAVTSMYIDGPVRSDTERQALKISVDKNQVSIVLFKGYNGEVTKQSVFQNNTASYTVFLKSLDKAQFGRAISKTVGTDERGYCPLRNRFVYTIENNGSDVMRAWTSSCGTGNFTGQHNLTRTLFLRQIPDKELRTFLNGTNFSTT